MTQTNETAVERARAAAEAWRVPDDRFPGETYKPKDDCVWGFEQGYLAALSPAETDGIREALEAAVAEVRAKAKFMIDVGADSGGWWLRLLSDLDTALKDTSE